MRLSRATRIGASEAKLIIGLDEFVNGDPIQIYARMRPDQRTAIAAEFARALRVAGDPRGEQFEEEWNRSEPALPYTLTVAEVAAVHSYTGEQHPELVEQVAQHPVTLAALANAGAPAEPDDEPAAEPAVIWHPEALVGAPSGDVVDIGQQIAPAPATPDPVHLSETALAEHEIRAHDTINEDIDSDGPMPLV